MNQFKFSHNILRHAEGKKYFINLLVFRYAYKLLLCAYIHTRKHSFSFLKIITYVYFEINVSTTVNTMLKLK